MASLIVLVGLPGCGKSYYANKYEDNKKTKIVSSDSIRKELYGKEEEQGDPSKVFKIMYNRTLNYLKEDFNVIYDATNIIMKKRYNLVHSLKDSLRGKKITYKCLVWAAPYDYCLYQNNKRDRKVPEEVIQRMYYNFEFPLKSEGWDTIKVITADKLTPIAEEYRYNLDLQLDALYHTKVDHDTPYHKVDLTTHMLLSASYLSKIVNNKHIKFAWKTYRNLYIALTLHDIGKFKTKTFNDNIAHYYNHENVGAYDLMCIGQEGINTNSKDFMNIIRYINYHMRPFTWSAKTREKYFSEISDELDFLHYCDIHCEETIV